MNHAAVLFNILALLTGLAALTLLTSSWLNRPDPGKAALIKFFSSYSFLIIVGAVYAYAHVNIDATSNYERIFTMLIMAGMAAIELTFPELMMTQRSYSPSLPMKVFIRTCAGLTVLLSIPNLLTQNAEMIQIFIATAFVPFVLVIVGSMIFIPRNLKKETSAHQTKSRLLALIVFIALSIAAAIELILFSEMHHTGTYVIISLPLAYICTTVPVLFASFKHPAAERKLPDEAILREKGLTPREIEISTYITQGRSNKEIAYELQISENTVRNHIANIFEKLSISRRSDLFLLGNIKPKV